MVADMHMPIADVSSTFSKIDADGNGDVDDEEFCDWLARETANIEGLLGFLVRRSALMAAQAATKAALQYAEEAEREASRLASRRELVAKFHQ